MKKRVCDKCKDKVDQRNSCDIEIFVWKDYAIEKTYLCQSCYQSFIVYFDNFMEEGNDSLPEMPKEKKED